MTVLAAPGASAAVRSSALRLAVLGGGALALAATSTTSHIGTVCPFKLITGGVPCPMCGGLRTATSVGRGDLLGALEMSPVVLLGAALVIVGPLGLERRWRALPVRTRVISAVAALVFAWVWQLARDGYLF